MLLILLALITAFAESPIAACAFRKRDGNLYVLLISALINLLTNLLLNGLCLPLLAGTPLSALWDGWLSLLLGELILAYIGEGGLYRILIRGATLGRSLRGQHGLPGAGPGAVGHPGQAVGGGDDSRLRRPVRGRGDLLAQLSGKGDHP